MNGDSSAKKNDINRSVVLPVQVLAVLRLGKVQMIKQKYMTINKIIRSGHSLTGDQKEQQNIES